MLFRGVVWVVLLLASSEALRILVVFPMSSKSHCILGHGVADRLLEAGHETEIEMQSESTSGGDIGEERTLFEDAYYASMSSAQVLIHKYSQRRSSGGNESEVVHMTGIPREKSVQNLTEISIANLMISIVKEDPDNFKAFTIKHMIGKPNFGDTMFFFDLTYNIHKLFLKEKNVVEFLSDPNEKFDAVILEWFFADFIAGIAPLFDSPLIWVGSTEAHWQMLKLVDGIPNPAYNVDLFSASTPPLSFWERAMELWVMVKKTAMISFRVTSREREAYDATFPSLAAKRGVPLPDYEDAVYNGSFLLINSHPSIGTPFSLPQNAKYIGGYHINDKVDPLPQDLQMLMDNAKHGVIFFSMGSNLKSADMSSHMRNSLLQMFAKLKQTIIWKFEDDLDNVPANIRLVKWAPQQSIFAHPNLKFFITHGGQLSTTEAIHYGVPVIGIPTFGDQFVNMDAVERKGFGIKLQLADDIAVQLTVAIEKMLSDPSYGQRAKELSRIYHDRPVPPGKELVHWVEHVARTRGAPHLRSPALLLPWYQKMYLDLAAIILTIIILIIMVVKRLIPNKTKPKPSKKKEKKS